MSSREIQKRWDDFILTRQSKVDGMSQDHENFITCLERESLIKHLIWSLDMANGVIDSYNQLKICIENEKRTANSS